MGGSLRTILSMLAAAALATSLAAPAAAQTDAAPREVVVLKPGQFVWYETATYARVSGEAGNGVAVVVSIPAQLAYVYRDNVLIAVSTISTGKPGKDTPAGEYTILQKKPFHRSNLYSNAPMPFMQRLTWDGIALHAGHLPGYPASHGCIRLPAAFAKKLYAITGLGGVVSVVEYELDDPQVSPFGAPPMLRVDTASLGGAVYDRVVANEAAPSLIDAVQKTPASWVTGPAQEIVQPIPGKR